MDTTDTTGIDAAGGEVPLEHLEHQICELAAHLSAAMCRWLLLVAEFDRREGWGHQGAKSCAQWLSWRCGLSLVSGREHLRVAHRLRELPVVRAAFAAGELSYSKVRAVARIATPPLRGHWWSGSPRHRRPHGPHRPGPAQRRHRRRRRRGPPPPRGTPYFWDEDGSLVLTARLGPDEGALVLQALDAAGHAVRNDAADDAATSPSEHDGDRDYAAAAPDIDSDAAASPRPPDSDSDSDADADSDADSDAAASSGDPDALVHDAAASPGPVTARSDAAASFSPTERPDDALAAARRRNVEAARIPATRADAFVALAETMLAHGPAARDGGERYQVVVTVGLDTLAGSCPDLGGEIDDGPWLASEAARRLACDSTVVAISLGDGGEPLNVGRATPSVPATSVGRCARATAAAASRAAASAASSTPTTSSTGPGAARRRSPIRACCAGSTTTP